MLSKRFLVACLGFLLIGLTTFKLQGGPPPKGKRSLLIGAKGDKGLSILFKFRGLAALGPDPRLQSSTLEFGSSPLRPDFQPDAVFQYIGQESDDVVPGLMSVTLADGTCSTGSIKLTGTRSGFGDLNGNGKLNPELSEPAAFSDPPVAGAGGRGGILTFAYLPDNPRPVDALEVNFVQKNIGLSLTGPINMKAMSAFQEVGPPPIIPPSVVNSQGEDEPIVITRNLFLLINSEILPQVAFGEGGDLTISTQITVNNPSPSTTNGSLTFFGQTGDPLEVEIDGEQSNQHEFTMDPFSSRVLEIDPTGKPVQIGWSLGWGEGLTFSATFSTFSPAAPASAVKRTPLGQAAFLVGEAGIGGSVVSTQHVLSAVQTEERVNTGFSMANPTDATAAIELTLLDSSGVELASGNLALGPLSQTSRFFPEFFGLETASFSGTLLISSDTDLAVASLKTKDGVQTSSLPTGAR